MKPKNILFLILLSFHIQTFSQISLARIVEEIPYSQFMSWVYSCEIQIKKQALLKESTENEKKFLYNNSKTICICIMNEFLEYDDELMTKWTDKQKNQILFPIMNKCVWQVKAFQNEL